MVVLAVLVVLCGVASEAEITAYHTITLMHVYGSNSPSAHCYATTRLS